MGQTTPPYLTALETLRLMLTTSTPKMFSLEDKSIDTTENAEFSMDLIRRNGLGNSISLITGG